MPEKDKPKARISIHIKEKWWKRSSMMVYTMCKLVKIYCYCVYSMVDTFLRLVGRTVGTHCFHMFFTLNLQQNRELYHSHGIKFIISLWWIDFSHLSCPLLMITDSKSDPVIDINKKKTQLFILKHALNVILLKKNTQWTHLSFLHVSHSCNNAYLFSYLWGEKHHAHALRKLLINLLSNSTGNSSPPQR